MLTEASSSVFDVSILKCVLQKTYPSLIIADHRRQWGARGFHIRVFICLGRNIGNLCFFGGTFFHVVSTKSPHDLVLIFQQGANRRWSVSLGVNACSIKFAKDSQLYNWYIPYMLSPHSTQLICCRLVHCYWLASIIRYSQLCLCSTYSRLNRLDSAQL